MALSWNETVEEKCYTNKSFKNDKERIEFLFGLYEEYLNA